MDQHFSEHPWHPRVVGWTGTGNHNIRAHYGPPAPPPVTLAMVLVLLFAQVLFAYYYIAARVCGITLARIW